VRVHVVVNPRAGRGVGPALTGALAGALRKRGHRVTVLATRTPDDATRWTQRAAAQPDCLVAVSGDDTLSELAPALIRHQIPLLPVPTGFGNVFTREFGHRADPAQVVHLVEHGPRVNVDVGALASGNRQPETVFLSAASFGFLDAAKRHAERWAGGMRERRRHLAYLLAATRCLSERPARFALLIDGTHQCADAAVAVISNVPAYPGHLLLTPDASPTDGLLDVCVLNAGSRRDLLHTLVALRRGAGAAELGLTRHRVRAVRVRTPDAAVEELRVRPGALRLVVPADYRARTRGHRPFNRRCSDRLGRIPAPDAQPAAGDPP